LNIVSIIRNQICLNAMKIKFERIKGQTNSSWLWPAVFAVAIILVVVSAIYPASDPDLYIMLATGRYVAQAGHAPTIDLWSHTAYGQPWNMHEWFSSLIFYLVFSLLGINGIILLKTLLLMLAFGLALYTMKVKGVSPNVALVTLVLGLLVSHWGFAERIQIFGFFFMVATQCWIELYKQGKIRYGTFAAVTVVGIILWANIHITFVFGVFLLGLYLLDEAVTAFKARKWTLALKPGLVFLSAFAATGANPYGYYYTISTLTYYFQPHIQKLDAQISGSILEYQPLYYPGFSRETFVLYGWIWIGFSLLGILSGWRRLKASFLIVWLLFTYWGVVYVRFLWMQVYVTLIGVAYHWEGTLQYIKARLDGPAGRRTGMIEQTVFLLLLALTVGGSLLYQKSGQHLWQSFGWGSKERAYPVKGAEFLKNHLDGGKVFNDFDIGGYLLWAKVPVFVDGRIGPYFNTTVIQDHFKILGGKLELLDKYGIDWQILPYARSNLTQEFERYNKLLVSTGRWALVYWDDVCLIYVRRIPKYDSVILNYEYKYVNPAVPDMSLPPRLFLGDLQRRLTADPELMLPYVLSCNYYFAQNDPVMAERQLEVAIQKDPYNGTLYNNLGNIYLRQGKLEAAIAAYKKAVRYNVNLGLAYCNWGFVMETLGQTGPAVKLYTIATKVTQGDAWPYNRLGIIEAKRGNRSKAMEYWRKGASIDRNSEAAQNLKNVSGGY